MKLDGEPALKTIQEEVRRQPSEKTILENSPVGDSRANGAAERAVQAIAEQVRVIRRGLEQRLKLRLSQKHPVTAWLVERAADLPSKCLVGDDGKSGYERWKGKLSMERRSSLVRRSTTARTSRPGSSRTSWKFVGTRVTISVVGGAQAKLLSGHVLVPCAALEFIAGGTVTVLNMSVVHIDKGDPGQGDVHPSRPEGEMVG